MMKKVPKRRFKGFLNAGDWEQRKFKNFVQIRRGLTYRPSDIASSGIRVLRSSNINEDQFITGTNDVFVNIDAVDIPYVKNGDILLTSANGSAHLVGKHAIINNIVENSAVHGGFMLLVESKNPQFINALLGSHWYKKFINLYVSGGNGAIGNLSKSDLEEQDVMLPSEEEQKAIGRVYFYMNHLITLHQRKLEKLQATKKALLYELFPIENSRRPKRRFKGFTGDWEQRKLEGLCDLFTDGDWIESKDQCGSGVRLIQTGNIGVTEYLDKPDNKKWISDETFNQLHCKEVFPGDILISRLPEPAGRACIIPHLGTKMITAVDCTIVRTSTNTTASFLVQYLSSQPYFNEVNKCLAGGTRQRISRSALAEFKVLVPSEKAEQDIIGKVFDKFDILITLHQRKLEKLKNLKAAYLNEMFV